MKKKFPKSIFIVPCFSILVISYVPTLKAENYQPQVTKLENWLLMNRDQATGLLHSHVGDERFENWAITYDSAVVTLAYIATGRINNAKRILDSIYKRQMPGE